MTDPTIRVVSRRNCHETAARPLPPYGRLIALRPVNGATIAVYTRRGDEYSIGVNLIGYS